MTQREPTWGRVSAAAHEHLVLIRNGEVLRAQQGGSVWKWPSDTVARIDTSVHRLQFTADQITRERVGVQVTGLAVFRIVAPLVAWGVVIDTIEIQDVRVLSAEVFERMQAPYRAELALSAVRAQADVAAAEARVKAEAEREIEIRRAAMLAQEQARIEQVRARARDEAEHGVSAQSSRIRGAPTDRTERRSSGL